MKIILKLLLLFVVFSQAILAEVIQPDETPPRSGASSPIEIQREQVRQFINNNQAAIQKNFLEYVVKNGIKQISRTPRRKAGEFKVEDLRLDSQYSYTSFDDDVLQSKGQFEDYTATLSGYITETTSFAIGVNHNRAKTRGRTELLIRSLGFNVSLHHKVTENYGVGTYFSYHDVDYEGINGNSWAYSTGIMGTTYHPFEYLSLSSATTIAYSDYDLNHDTVFMSMWSIDRQWSDKINTFAYISFTDSLRTGLGNQSDGTYWLYGLGIDYLLSEKVNISVTYEKTEALNNYKDNTVIVNLGYSF